jgi:hypothetical protein
MSTPTQQVCARCGSPADDGDVFCANCGAAISRRVTQPPPSSEYVRREPETDSEKHTASAHNFRPVWTAGQVGPQAQAPGIAPSEPSPFNTPPQPDPRPDAVTVQSLILRMPVWARLVALGIVGLFILVVVSAIHGSGVNPNSPAGIIQTSLIGTTVNDGTTVTNARCAPASVDTSWGDGSISANCTVTFSDGSTAVQFVEVLAGNVEDEEDVPSLTSTP